MLKNFDFSKIENPEGVCQSGPCGASQEKFAKLPKNEREKIVDEAREEVAKLNLWKIRYIKI